MKILLVHNNYGTYSGEEAVVDSMVGIYTSLGYEVAEYRKSTEAIQANLKGQINAFIRGIFPSMNVGEFRVALDRQKPDVVHIHNLYPFIGAAILRLCKRRGVKIIMTVHNYRLICPTGLFMRDERPCEECLKRGGEWSCIKYNCEHSMLKSVGYALRNMVARKKRYYKDNVDLYCCLTEFQRQKLIEAGFDGDKIVVIPNSCKKPLTIFADSTNDYIGYCGRLSAEKGIDMIFEVARRNPEITFKLAGAARDIESDIPSNCILLGHLSGDQFSDFVGNARFMVMASRWYEGFPMAILDAVSYGKCVVAPDHGGFSEITQNRGNQIGELFKPNNLDDFDAKLVALWNDHARISIYSKNGQQAFSDYYSPKVSQRCWQEVINNLQSTSRYDR